MILSSSLRPATPAEREVNDTFAGVLCVVMSIGLDDSDGNVTTTHDLAQVLLQCANAPLNMVPRA